MQFKTNNISNTLYLNNCEYTNKFNENDKTFDTEEECKKDCEKLKKWFNSCDDNELYFPGNCSGQSDCFSNIFNFNLNNI